jgi:hypothetical protein
VEEAWEIQRGTATWKLCEKAREHGGKYARIGFRKE